jgi:hypothetical protein
MRHAILFSGMSFKRHVNGLEFCYRTLVDQLGFATDAIHVLNYDGSLRCFGGTEEEAVGVWPGDGTDYRMVVGAEGNRRSFQQALRAVGARLQPDDQLFINITGHGGHRGDEDGPDLLTYPFCRRYRRDEFRADLGLLPEHRTLVVLMAQCFSGGFIPAVLAASPARQTYIATATTEKLQSFVSFHDGNWDSFQRNWIAGIAGHTVHEAFQYATRPDIVNPYDSPQFAARPTCATEATLMD